MTARPHLPDSAHIDSPVQRANAGTKLAVAVLLVTGITLLPSRQALWALLPLAALIGLARAGRLPLSVFAVHLAIAQPFVLGVAVLALFQGDGLLAFGAIALQEHRMRRRQSSSWYSRRGSRTCSMPYGAHVCPPCSCSLSASFTGSLHSHRRTQTHAPGSSSPNVRGRPGGLWAALASTVAVSFIRSMARSERIAMAMRARGWS